MQLTKIWGVWQNYVNNIVGRIGRYNILTIYYFLFHVFIICMTSSNKNDNDTANTNGSGSGSGSAATIPDRASNLA